jgi:integrase
MSRTNAPANGRPVITPTAERGISKLVYDDGGVLYRPRWKDGGGRNGKVSYEYFRDLKEAVRFRAAVVANGMRRVEWPPRNSTEVQDQDTARRRQAPGDEPVFRDACALYLISLGIDNDRTLRDYATMYDNHVDAVIGSMGIGQIAPEDLERLLTRMRKKGRAAKTQLNVWGTVVAPVFDWMLTRKQYKTWLQDGNPCPAVKLPTGKDKKIPVDKVLMPDEAPAFLGYAYKVSTRLGDAVTFDYLTGLRFSELVALRVGDIDLVHGHVRVARVARRQADASVEIEHRGKTPAAFRIVPLAGESLAIAEKLCKDRPAEAVLLRAPLGGMWLQLSWYRNWTRLLELARKQKFEKHITTHGLRHGFRLVDANGERWRPAPGQGPDGS